MRRHNIKEINLKIDDIEFFSSTSNNGGINIDWSSDIGFGTYSIFLDDNSNLCAESERMDSQEDKEFISELMNLVIKELVILG